MGDITDAANQVYKDFAIVGDPESGENKPDKWLIRDLFGKVQTALDTVNARVDAVPSSNWNKDGAKYATTAALPTYTYDNGIAGAGATITFSATGVYAPDGTNLALNDTLLVKDETSGNAPYNGKYKCTTAGAAGVATVLTRATDADSPSELDMAAFAITAGSANAGKGFGLSVPASAIVLGTAALVFSVLPSLVSQEAAARASADAAATLRSDQSRYSLQPHAVGQLPMMDAGGNGLWWVSLMLDGARKILWGKKNDGSEWAANGSGGLVQTVAPVAQPGGAVAGVVLSVSSNTLPLMDAGNGLWWLWLKLDAARKIEWGQKSDGSVWVARPGGSVLVQQGNGTQTAPAYATDTNYTGPANPNSWGVYGTLTVAATDAGFVDMFVALGQSYDQTGNHAAFDAPFVTAALDAGKVLMLSAGLFPNGASSASFVDAYAQTQSGAFEPFGPLAGNIVQAAFTAAGISGPKFLAAVAARGGTPVIGIKRGTTAYNQAIQYVVQAAAIARGNGQTLRVRGLVTRHGENDMNSTFREVFARQWLSLRRDFEADVRAITGQVEPVLLFTYQNCDGGMSNAGYDPNATLAQLDLCDLDPNHCFLSFPGYWIGPQDNQGGANAGSHFMAMGWAQMDEAEGYAIRNAVYGPRLPELRTRKGRAGAYWSSTTAIELFYSQPVLLDTSNAIVDATQLSAYGFDFTDGSVSPPAISTVTQAAAPLSITPSGSNITFGAGADPQQCIVLVYSGTKYCMLVDSSFTGAIIAAGFAAAIGGASASGAVLTLPGAPTNCVAYSNHLTVTLASAPAGKNPVLRYANRTTGTGKPGNQTCGRGLVRSPKLKGLSKVARGKIAHGSNPAPGDAVTVNGVTVTYVASGASGNQVNIAGSAAATALALYTFLSGQTADTSLNKGRYGMDATGTVVLVHAPVAANFTLSKSSSALTVTAPAAIEHYDWAAVERIDLPAV